MHPVEFFFSGSAGTNFIYKLLLSDKYLTYKNDLVSYENVLKTYLIDKLI